MFADPIIPRSLSVENHEKTLSILLVSTAVEDHGEHTNVADLAYAVATNFTDPQRLVRKASGSVLVYHYGDTGLQANYVNPATGNDLGVYESSGFLGFSRNNTDPCLQGILAD